MPPTIEIENPVRTSDSLQMPSEILESTSGTRTRQIIAFITCPKEEARVASGDYLVLNRYHEVVHVTPEYELEPGERYMREITAVEIEGLEWAS